MIDRHATTEEVLDAWDAGEPVWSVKAGGLTESHEQDIQTLGFSFLRWMMENPPDEGWDSLKGDRLRNYAARCEVGCDDAVSRIGPTGGQFGAAITMAGLIAKHGYARRLAMEAPENHILVTPSHIEQPALRAW